MLPTLPRSPPMLLWLLLPNYTVVVDVVGVATLLAVLSPPPLLLALLLLALLLWWLPLHPLLFGGLENLTDTTNSKNLF